MEKSGELKDKRFENQCLILDLEIALRVSIVVQNGAIGVKWKNELESTTYNERLFSNVKDANLFISNLLEDYLLNEKNTSVVSNQI